MNPLSTTHQLVVNEWVIRMRRPEGVGPFPVYLLLHGWTGDEEAMWIFTPRLPTNALILAPRGLFIAGPGGYSWYGELARPWPRLEDFYEAVDKLTTILNIAIFPQGNFDELHVIGFSQGAAATYAFTLLNPERVASAAGLAGFMPDGAASLASGERLKGMPVFVTHGTKDVLVPVERGREAARILTQAGAVVTYCEDDVGHKLSANCFRGLEYFYRDSLGGCVASSNH
jgi:phospholipase/carboxylesterase